MCPVRQDDHPELRLDPALGKSAGNPAQHCPVYEYHVDRAHAERDPQGKSEQRHPDVVGNHETRQKGIALVPKPFANVGRRLGPVEFPVPLAQDVGHHVGRSLHRREGHQGTDCSSEKLAKVNFHVSRTSRG